METLTNKKNKLFVTASGDALKDLKARYQFMTPFAENIGKALLIGLTTPHRKASLAELMLDAMKDNIDAVKGLQGKYYLSFPELKISRGELAAPKISVLKYLSKKRVSVTWENQPQAYADKERMVYLVQYNVTLDESFIWYHHLPVDDDGAEILSPAAHYGHEIHYWLFFTDMEGEHRSDSVYVGQIRPLSN